MTIGKLTAAAVLALTFTACGGDGDEQETAALAAAESTGTVATLNAADIATATREDVGASVIVTGSLNPYRIVDVRAQVPGVLTSLTVDRGSVVQQGQAVARIEAEGIRGQAAGARAAVAAARAQLALANRQMESARKLHAAGAMSDIEFQQATTAYEAAEAQVAAAEAQALGAGESARRATVVAPISGEVSQRMASQGEAVSPGQTLLTIVDSRILELAGQVPVNQAARIQPGQTVEFTLDAFPGRVLTGRVARVDPTADPATRNIGVYVQVPNADRSLLGGLFATGRIAVGGTSEAVVIPIAALRADASGDFVWAIANDQITRRAVVVGARDEARGVVQIVQGLEAGTQVIAVPGEVREGMPVRVTASAATTDGE